MLFKQISKLTTRYEEEVEENIYEYVFAVKPRGDTEKNSVIYDKELKMYFENPSGAVYTYEIEFTNVKLTLCRRLKKSKNFNRKLFYRYDFIRPKVNSKGQVISILNKAELKHNWSKLKTKMNIDHKGNYVESYLNKIDAEFTMDESIYPSINQYMYFGLLFFNLPKTHSKDWQGRRLIEFSPYEKEKFEEKISVSSFTEKEITYEIQGNILQNSDTSIEQYTGTAIKAINENFAQVININSSVIKDDIIREWDFTFYKI